MTAVFAFKKHSVYLKGSFHSFFCFHTKNLAQILHMSEKSSNFAAEKASNYIII